MSGPFDKARYSALLEGLEISILSLGEWKTNNENGRWDSEYFAKDNLRSNQQIAALKHTPLSKLVTRIQHPAEIKRSYEEAGLHIVLAQNVRDNWFNFSDRAYMQNGVEKQIAQNWIHSDDVLMTRSGANCGQTACWKFSENAFTCADILMLRSPKCPGGYLSTFLNTAHGKRLVLRGAYGMAQPHIAPSYLENLLIPRFGKLEKEIDHLVEASVKIQERSDQNIEQAEQTLLAALGLADWHPPEPLTYTCCSKDVQEAGRFDSQYFAPRVAQLLVRLGKDGLTVRDVAPPRAEKFTPLSEGTFRYIEISDLQSNGTATCGTIDMRDAPSRATWIVMSGDVLTSTVRPNRRLSALVTPEQDGCVASSGFVVLQPKRVAPEVLLTYLRLPVFCELMDLHTSASLYPAISDRDLLALPFPKIAPRVSEEIIAAVRSAHDARWQAQAFLSRAQRAVEIAIEEDEASALRFLKEKGV